MRWWWNNSHQAVYDAGDGTGWVPHGPSTEWIAQSKPITFAEYGVPTLDKGTNQPNVFYDPRSSESATPYWSSFDPIAGGAFQPTRDDTLAALALDAIAEYWVSDGNNEIAGTVKMIEPTFMSAWAWDARPFPAFPLRADVWGDAANWPFGPWIGGKGPALPPPGQPAPPMPGTYSILPQLSARSWSVHQTPTFATHEASFVSGRSRRTAKMAAPLWEFELTYDVLSDTPGEDFAALIAFFNSLQGTTAPFRFEPAGLSPLAGQMLGTGDGTTTTFVFQRSIGAYAEPLAAVFDVTSVYELGVPMSSSFYAIDATGFLATLTFATAPAMGASISADFSYYSLCRFADDFEDVEEFAARLFRLKSLKLRSVKL